MKVVFWLTYPVAIVLAISGSAQASTAHRPNQGRSFYVDCSNPNAKGNGLSAQQPWNSLNQLNTTTFAPGDVIALKRGTVCHGVLAPQGSGRKGAPIRLTAYGEGPRPKVIAGRSPEESLKLFNQQYWNIDSLDLSGGHTYGIFISGNQGILHHIYLSNLAVHDVFGGALKHKESGLVAITPGSVNQHFDNVVVDNVTAWNTNQWVGIVVGGGNLGYPPENDWSSNVEIRNSAIHDVQGDGIVLFRVRHGRIDSSVAWNTGMQDTQSIGTPNAIWTWMCDDCTVQNNEAYLTDSPGVDGGAYDIDYGNTKNSVIDNYGHDTQGYCVAVFGAGFVTKQSIVRGNLCIDNGRSPRMAKYQGAIFLLSWNGGSIDGLTMENNTIYWNPFEDAPALLNEGNIKPGTAVFRDNTIYSTSPWLVDSNASLLLAQNHYTYFGAGNPEWRYGAKTFDSLQGLQDGSKQKINGSLVRQDLNRWDALIGLTEPDPGNWRLSCTLPIALDPEGLISDAALRQIVALKSLAQQYRSQGLQVILNLTSDDSQLFRSKTFRNALTDLDLQGITVHQAASQTNEQTTLSTPSGKVAGHWDGYAGPVSLGFGLRRALGAPVYAQMGVDSNE